MKKISIAVTEESSNKEWKLKEYLFELDLKKKERIADADADEVLVGQGDGVVGDNAGLIDLNNWRAKLPPGSRRNVVNHIMDAMKKHLSFPRKKLYEGLREIKKTALGFEGRAYSTAKSQSDYLRMITLKTRSFGPKAMANSLQTTAASNSTDLESTAESKKTDAGDWQEEAYQKIKSMKDMYLLQMKEIHVKISAKLQQLEALPQPTNKQVDKVKLFKHMMERFIRFVHLVRMMFT